MARKKVEIELSAIDKASLVFKKIGDSAGHLKKQLTGLSGNLSGAFSDIGAGAMGTGVAGALGLGSALAQAGDFEHALFQMTKVTDESTESIRQKMLALPASIGSVTENTQAYYQVMSAGVTDAAQAMDTLTTASKLAAVAGVSSGEAITALTKMMAGYRGEISKVSDASDLLLDIEQLGQTDVAQLIPVIGDIASISQTAGVSVKEMAASLSLLTQTAGSTSQAATQLRALEQAFLNPNEDLKKVFAALGYGNGDGTQLIKDKGLVGALNMVGKTAEANKLSLASLLGSIDAFSAYTGLASNGFAIFADILSKVGTQAGRTEASFKQFELTFKGVLQEGQATLSNFGTAWGEGFLPVVKDGLADFTHYVANNRDTIAQWGKDGGDALTSLKNGVDGLLSVWGTLPEDIKGAAGYGLVGAMLFGKKGAVLGLALHLGEVLHNSLAGFEAWQKGQISFGEYATSNKEELQSLLKKRQQAASITVPRPSVDDIGYDETVFRNAMLPKPKAQSTSIASTLGAFVPPQIASAAKKSGVSQIASAKEKLQELREEINRLNGVASQSGNELAKKLRDIADAGGKAKLSAQEIATMQADFTQAFQADALRDFDKELATLTNDTGKLREIEKQTTLQEWQTKFAEIGLSAEEASPKIAALNAALEQESHIKDLQSAAQFYQQLAEKTGEYSTSLEYQTQLLEKQRELWIGMGIPVQDVTEMMRLQREELEETVALNERFAAINSRTKELMQDKYYDKPLAGIELSFLDSARDAFAFRDQMRDSFTSMFGTIADAGTSAFQTIFTGGTFEANKFFANLTAQLAAQAASAAGNTLIKGIFGLLGNALMSGFTGALGQNMFTGTAPLMPIAGGSSWSSPIAGMHDGGVVGRDATFTRAMPLSLWAQAPRYHTGGMAGFRPDELPIIAQRGETILSRADSGGIGAKLDAIVSLLSAQQTTQGAAGSGNTNVVLVDDQRKVKNYLLSPEGGRTFVTMLNNNRQSIQNIANGGRA